ncbi:MAG: tetratricopeptide repeat protein [Candidatus Melainabacteria bacterium]|nr:tetratricopeptide repeat protein [Candidatus Melainabacteria bacterium]
MDWDTSSFGNDGAQEWLRELGVSKTGESITRAIETVDNSDNFIDSADAERAVAACEMVCASRGFASAGLPPEVTLWIKSQRYRATDELSAKASSVIARVIASSELRDLWDGTEAAGSWLKAVNDLQDRLGKIEKTPTADNQSTANSAAVDAAFNEAVELISEGNHEAAVEKYDHALALNPAFAVGYIGRGTSYLALGKFEEAVFDLNKAIDLEPEITEIYYLRAQAHFQTGSTGRAIADLTILINMVSDRADAFFMRGLANAEMGRHEKAIDDFSKAIELEPDLVNSYLHRSEAYERVGRFDMAGKDRKQYERLTGTTRAL